MVPPRLPADRDRLSWPPHRADAATLIALVTGVVLLAVGYALAGILFLAAAPLFMVAPLLERVRIELSRKGLSLRAKKEPPVTITAPYWIKDPARKSRDDLER